MKEQPMTEAEAVKLAEDVVSGWVFDSTVMGVEQVKLGELKKTVAAALLAASRPGEGMIRTHEGKDLRLLGTLPVTADGCVAMPDECNVYAPGCDEALQPVRSIRFDEDPNTMAERLRECGFQFPGESLPEFVAVWTDYDRDTGAYDEFVAPLSACYSTPEAASAAKGVGDA